MEFKTVEHKLVARICDFYQKSHLFDLGQVRATKLIYLIEYEYYGWEQQRFTDLDWIFWNYGPWSKTLSMVLTRDFHTPVEEEIEPGKFRPVRWTPPQFDKPTLRFDPTIEGIILRIFEQFVTMPYGELLDYVYFETEPMQNVTRGQELDFSVIPKTEPFVDPVSLLSPQVFHQLRKSGDELEIPEAGEIDFRSLTDSAILESIANFDKETSFELPKGKVQINGEDKTNLRKSFES